MAEESLARKLAAIFHADIAGYSRLTGADEEGTPKTLSAYLDAISTLIEGHGGLAAELFGIDERNLLRRTLKPLF